MTEWAIVHLMGKGRIAGIITWPDAPQLTTTPVESPVRELDDESIPF